MPGTVIDIGSARYGGDYSIEHLIAELKPKILYAFDPNMVIEANEFYDESGTLIRVSDAAAWTHNGRIGFFSDGLNSRIDVNGEYNWPTVRCFDLAQFIRGLKGSKPVLKIDAEGSEYPLLEHLIETGTDKRLRFAWVEWHCLNCGRGGGGHRERCPGPGGEERRRDIEQRINCEIREWGW